MISHAVEAAPALHDLAVLTRTLDQHGTSPEDIGIEITLGSCDERGCWDDVANAVIEGVETNLETALDGVAGGLVGLTDEVQAQIVDTIVADVSDQLEPVEQNLLDLTLNKQVRPAQGHIEVTGIDLRVLPAAAEELGAPLVSAQIANVSCGPNSQVTPDAQDGEPAHQDDGGGLRCDRSAGRHGDRRLGVVVAVEANPHPTTEFNVDVFDAAPALGKLFVVAALSRGLRK